jgi:hypothetical protein
MVTMRELVGDLFKPVPGCTGKKRHPTRAAAQEHARSLKLREEKEGIFRRPLREYRCDHCQHWHVGHSSGGRSKRIDLKLDT